MDPGPLGKVDAMIFLLFSQEAAAPDPSCPTLILKKKNEIWVSLNIDFAW